ncbi:MAG: protein kinase [Acidobacteriota bacterium]|nr:protein kinase [Acidobacteriota bacterium]
MTPGTRLGPYEVLSLLGAGGMGQVYRAKDSTLKREVALKVLPADVAKDRERLARFQREAEVLASLNHPHIAQIYGLEHVGDTFALVMELVEGEDLSQRIARGPIPLDEALPIAQQIAEALETAHDHGIIHRDLKPANIKVRPDGAVKVLDFGLAKAVDPSAGSSATAMNSPTLSIHATEAGIILGTAAYMSPEQARGKAVDRRTDIWAFGAVLFEMLTGKRAFPGDDATDTIVAVVSKEPEWSALPAAVPAGIQRLLRRALNKDSKRRLDSVGGARIEIDEALISPSAMDSAFIQPAMIERALLPRVLPWMVASALAAGLVLVLAFWVPRQTAVLPVSRAVITPPEGVAGFDRAKPVLSPDGTQLVFAAAGQLYLRSLARFDAEPIPGTAGAGGPFFSPDGHWLGFFANQKLQKVSLEGGTPMELFRTIGGPNSATWGADGAIVFSPGGGTRGLLRLPDSGGDSQVIANPKGIEETAYRSPQVLPNGEGVVFTTMLASGSAIVARLKSGEQRVLIPGGADARVLPSGHLLYMNAGRLMAIAFDQRRVEIAGTPKSVLEGLTYGASGEGLYNVSTTGTLVYIKGGLIETRRRFVWVDRAGHTEPLATPTRNYSQFSLSPDGQSVVVMLPKGTRDDIETYDIKRNSFTRLTFDADNRFPFWAPDGLRVTYQSRRSGSVNVFQKRADGNGGEEQVPQSASGVPTAWSADGKALLSFRNTPAGDRELWVSPIGELSKERFVLRTRSAIESARVSHNGRWIAYLSNESGRLEVYVQPFDGGGSKWQISTEGGMEPLWSGRDDELFYRNGAKMMAVNVRTALAFSADTPRVLFDKPFFGPTIPTGTSGVSPDGQRFLMLEPVEAQKPVTEIHIVLNWAEELKRLLPTPKQ